ncbi:class I SAM-dependent methyltransferase [Brevibacillus migulae]|uniref:class I SAM-dependent methyltransferase n=1 Tax=Brevibacillus migulae TaxID=1644114 RepID=UPI00106E8AD2|nr:class I SAM-dependent methyltransferase [Brevibacillus migulae]
MKYCGSQFYDNDENFQSYQERRSQQENANDTLEKPVFLEMLGDVKGLRILDLGCGDAAFGRELLARGCSHYTGVEGSKNMMQAAVNNLAGTTAEVIHETLEKWDFPPQRYDLVISRLVLHYIEDLAAILSGVYRTLRPNGRIVFSVEHPTITSTLQPSGTRANWIVDRYFHTGYREQQWMGGQVFKYHRTIEDYFLLLQQAGFRVEALRESRPQRENFLHEETYLRRMRIPLFLFLAGTKS